MLWVEYHYQEENYGRLLPETLVVYYALEEVHAVLQPERERLSTIHPPFIEPK